MRCLLIGNYGVGNLGDEALKEYFVTRFPEVEWVVLSADPTGAREVPRLPFGLRSLLTTPWWKTLRAVRISDAVVFGGGSLFTDVESVRACLLWWWHAFVARLFRKPVLLAFQGIGPFTTRVGEWCARNVLRRAAFISVRDEESGRRAREGATIGVIDSADPVLMLFDAAHRTTPGDALAIIPRQNSGGDFRRRAMDAAEGDRTSPVIILSMQPDSPLEQECCRALAQAIGPRTERRPVRSLRELTAVLTGCSRVITARYHGALAALALGIETEIIPQHPGDKLDALRSVHGGQGIAAMRARIDAAERELRKSLNVL